MSELEKRETLAAFASLPEETKRGFAAGYACAMGVAETQAHAQEETEEQRTVDSTSQALYNRG